MNAKHVIGALLFCPLVACGGSHAGTYLGTTTTEATVTPGTAGTTKSTVEKGTARFENHGAGGLAVDLGGCWAPLTGVLNTYSLEGTFKCDIKVTSESSATPGVSTSYDSESTVTSADATFDGAKVKLKLKFKTTRNNTGPALPSTSTETNYTYDFDGERISKD